MNDKLTKDDAFKNVRAEYMSDDAFKNGYPISFPESYKAAPIENCNPSAQKEVQSFYQPYQTVKEEVKPKKSKAWIIILVVVVLLLLAGAGAYYYFILKPKNDKPVVIDDKPNNTVVDNEPYDINKLSGLRKDDTSNYQNTYTFSYSTNGEDYYVCENQCDKSIGVKTNNSEIDYEMNYKDRFIFYIDGNDYKILDINSGEIYIINLESVVSSYSEILVCVDELTNHLIGAITTSNENDNDSFFSFKLNKNLYDKKYNKLNYLNDSFMEATDQDCLMDETGETGDCNVKSKLLLSTNSEDILKQYDYTNDMEENDEEVFYHVIFNEKDTDKNVYIQEEVLNVNDSMSTIYNKKLNVVVGLINSNIFSVNSNGLVYVVDSEDVKAYNEDGEVVKTNNSYKAQMVLYDYIVAVKEGSLILATFDGKEVVITGWDDNSKLDKYYSKVATELRIGVKDVAPGKQIIYLVDRENWKAWYYNPETGEVGNATLTQAK